MLRAHRTARPPAAVVVVTEGGDRLRAVRRRLGLLLAGYCAALQLIAAAEGHSLRPSPTTAATWWSLELLTIATAHGALLGYFLGFALRRRRAITVSAVVGAAFGAALAITKSPGEWATILVVTPATATGAMLGAAGFLRIASRLRAKAANEAVLVAPDLPLVGGAYLAAPLLWLTSASVARQDAAGAPESLILLALFGASLIGSARASRGPAGGSVLAHGAAASAWCLVGLAPLAAVAPWTAVVLGAVAGVFAAVHPILLGATAVDRRIEGPAVRRVLPLLATYMALAAVAPIAGANAGRIGAWPTWASLAVVAPVGGWAQQMSANLVLGYALAELRGRRAEGARRSWRAARPWLVLSALLTSVPRAVIASPNDTFVRLCLAVGGAALLVVAGAAGVGLYDLQRRYARAHCRDLGAVRGVARERMRGATPGRSRAGYIRRSCPRHNPPCSTPGPCSARSSAWPTRSSS